MMYTLKAASVFLEDGILEDGWVTVGNGVIQSAGVTAGGGREIDLRPLTLAPGFIDIHAHGARGYDTMDCSREALAALSLHKLEEGVTSFCPTTVTAPREQTEAAVRAVGDAMAKGVDGARIIGVFLEGPFISPRYKGAHDEAHIRGVDLEEIARWAANCPGCVRSVAIAPELPGAREAIALLLGNGITPRIGHSAATYEQARDAIEQGARIGIHTFNAMSPLAHREPGMAGALLDNHKAFCEVICDLVHVHPAAVRVLLKCKGPDRLVLVTDCMRAAGLADGIYTLGSQRVFVDKGVCRLKDGVLAGSTLRMDQAVRNMVREIGAAPYEAVRMASATPARALGIETEAGGIAPGKRADLVGLDENLRVRFVMAGGEIRKMYTC